MKRFLNYRGGAAGMLASVYAAAKWYGSDLFDRTKNSERNFSLPEKADATLPTAVPQRNCLSPSLPTRAFYTVPSTGTRTTM